MMAQSSLFRTIVTLSMKLHRKLLLKDNKIDIFNGTYAEYKDRELNQVVVSTKPAEVVKAKL